MACWFRAASLLCLFALSVSSLQPAWAYVPAEYQPNYDEGFDSGFSIGYDFGFITGQKNGKRDGTAAGETEGYQTGWDDAYGPAYDKGYEAEYSVGFQFGHDEGLVIGYDSGFDEGFEEGVDWAANAFTTYSLVMVGESWILTPYSSSAGLYTVGTYGGSVSISGSNFFSGLTIASLGNLDFDWEGHYFDKGYDDGHEDGLATGNQEGYDLAYPAAYDEAFDIAYPKGAEEGDAQGLLDGSEEGYEKGWDDGYEVGWDDGYNIGHFDGFDAGLLYFYALHGEDEPDVHQSFTRFFPRLEPGEITLVESSPEPIADTRTLPEPTSFVLLLMAATAAMQFVRRNR